jgi:hypothetical protein
MNSVLDFVVYLFVLGAGGKYVSQKILVVAFVLRFTLSQSFLDVQFSA